MILITGGAGYIGSHCALKFMEEGHKVFILDNLQSGSADTIEALKKLGKVEFMNINLQNLKDVAECISNMDIECVLHLADSNPFQDIGNFPEKYYYNNILSVLNILDLMLKNGINYFIYSSSLEVYGKPVYYPIDEIHPQLPDNAYGRSKSFAEKIIEDYDASHGIKSIKLRYSNAVCGYNQQLLEKEIEENDFYSGNYFKSALYNANEIDFKDYIDVQDIANAHYIAYKSLLSNKKSNSFNLGIENKLVINDNKNLLQKFFDKPKNKIKSDTEKHVYSKISIKKAKKILGWQPTVMFNDSMQQTIKQETNFNQKLMNLHHE